LPRRVDLFSTMLAAGYLRQDSVAIKTKYDAHNLFRRYRNIPPPR